MEGGELQVDVRVRNAGAGCDPDRGTMQSDLTIEASGFHAALASSGGDEVPDFGGYHELKERVRTGRAEDARVGQGSGWCALRVTFTTTMESPPAASMSIEERGMERETLVAERRIAVSLKAVVMDQRCRTGICVPCGRGDFVCRWRILKRSGGSVLGLLE